MLGKHILYVKGDVLWAYYPFPSVKLCWNDMDSTIALHSPKSKIKSLMLTKAAFI